VALRRRGATARDVRAAGRCSRRGDGSRVSGWGRPGLVLSEFVSSTVERVGKTSTAAAARLGHATASLLAGTLADDGDLAAGDAADDLREHITAYVRAPL
jgi:hypothetical protein